MLEISRLEGIEKDAALALAWEVFMEFEAPDYEEAGILTFKDFIEDPAKTDPLTVYGAYAEGILAGMSATREGGGHIALLFVRPSHHRQGIARALLSEMKDDCPGTVLTVHSSPYARDIYRRMGFEATGEEQVRDGIRFIPMKLEWVRQTSS